MGEDFTGLIIAITIIAHLPAIIMLIIGLAIRRSSPNTAKVLFIISGVYLIIGLGICGAILT